jgi:hypothetical protein
MHDNIQALQIKVYSLKSMGCNGRLRALTILFANIAADLVREDQKDLLRRALPPFMKDSPDSWLKARKTAGELALKAPKGHPVAKILLALEALDGPPHWGENKEPCLIVAAAASEWVQGKDAIRKLQSEFVKHADIELAGANFQGKLPGIQAKRQESAQEPRPSRPQPAPDAPAGSPGREGKLIQLRYELPPFLASLLDEASDSSRTKAGVRTKAQVVAEGIDALSKLAKESNIPPPKRSGRAELVNTPETGAVRN